MNERPKAALFVNPLAARHRRGLRGAETLLARHFDLRVHRPLGVAAMSAAVATEAAAGCTLAIAAGGDGTVNIVINALAGRPIPLGVLPIGTANDLARELGLPPSPVAAAERIIAGRTRVLDLLTVNGIRFCTVGGAGLVALCAHRANGLRSPASPCRPLVRMLGSAIYAIEAFREIAFHPQPGSQVTLTGQAPAKLHGLFIANQTRLGGNLCLPVTADPADGRFELCLLPAGPRRRLLAALLALRLGRPLPAGTMSVQPSTGIRITCADEWLFLGDGEILTRGREFELKVLPRALSVCC